VSGCPSEAESPVEALHAAARKSMAAIPHKMLVMSGKGGVGKTTVAVNLAFAFGRHGLRVGILDTDLHGPDVAFMTGVEGVPGASDGARLRPIEAGGAPDLRVRVLSISAFLPGRDSPVIWRGPRKASAIAQLLGEADWDGVDVLVVDCPPGTGDEPLSVAQLVPGAAAVIVTSPQEVALLDSRKCVNFARALDLRVLGIVENLAGFVCPDCGRRIDLFKMGGGERAAREMKVPFLGRIPITEAMVEAGDSGKPLVVHHPDDPAAKALAAIAGSIEADWRARERADGPADTRGKEDVMQGVKVIAVAAEDELGLEGQVSGHFGRCPAYVLVETKGADVVGSRVVRNPHYGNHQPGQMPTFIHGLGAHAILAGGMGPRAVDMFHEFNMEVATGAVGKVRNVVAAYLRGEIKGIVPCAHDHPESCGDPHDHEPGDRGAQRP